MEDDKTRRLPPSVQATFSARLKSIERFDLFETQWWSSIQAWSRILSFVIPNPFNALDASSNSSFSVSMVEWLRSAQLLMRAYFSYDKCISIKPNDLATCNLVTVLEKPVIIWFYDSLSCFETWMWIMWRILSYAEQRMNYSLAR